ELYEIYAEYFTESEMLSFVEIEDIIFNTKTQMVVDPSEERLKTEFAGVKRFYIPVHSVIRIDEVEKPGVAKITNIDKNATNISQFPTIYSRPSSQKEVDK
ncbi:MAG: DUF1820 family protein, partial [Pseudomonadota bacterium]